MNGVVSLIGKTQDCESCLMGSNPVLYPFII